MNDAPTPLLPDFDPGCLVDSLADGLYITDTERRILLWNRAAERITGWKAGEVVGRTCFDNILCHVNKDGHRLCGEEHCPLHRSVVTGRSSETPLLVFALSKSGGRVPMEVTVAPLRNRAGEVVGGIEAFRDASVGVHDLLRAKAIQDLALKCEEVEDPRYEIESCHQACDLVGGDFHRSERLDDGRLALLVADVMGHGVPAALYTMHLASLWEQHREDLGAPARFLGILNEHLCIVAGEAGFFATAVFAVYRPDSGELVLARAGHPAPLLFRPGAEPEPVGQRQPALGMLPGLDYAEVTTRLDPGDEVLFFTDGAIEVADADDRELGVAGLCQLVGDQVRGGSGTFHVDALEEQLLRSSNEVHLADDLTLAKLRRRS